MVDHVTSSEFSALGRECTVRTWYAAPQKLDAVAYIWFALCRRAYASGCKAGYLFGSSGLGLDIVMYTTVCLRPKALSTQLYHMRHAVVEESLSRTGKPGILSAPAVV